jgi:hypothetical protein
MTLCPLCDLKLAEQTDLNEAVEALEPKLEMKVWSNER